MIIEVLYAEIAFLRELVAKEKHRIWREDWLPLLTCDDDKTAKIFMEWDEKRCEGIPLDNLDCCRRLLSNFAEVEENIQVAFAEAKKE